MVKVQTFSFDSRGFYKIWNSRCRNNSHLRLDRQIRPCQKTSNPKREDGPLMKTKLRADTPTNKQQLKDNTDDPGRNLAMSMGSILQGLYRTQRIFIQVSKTNNYKNESDPSIHFLTPILSGVTGVEPISASSGEGGVTLDTSPVHHRADI